MLLLLLLPPSQCLIQFVCPYAVVDLHEFDAIATREYVLPKLRCTSLQLRLPLKMVAMIPDFSFGGANLQFVASD